MDTPYTVAAAILAVVEDAFAACSITFGSKLVAAGGLVIDDPCVGVLIVAPERIFRTRAPFPLEAFADDTCVDTPIAVELVVRVDRCFPVLDERGRAPSIVEQEAAFTAALLDAAIVWGAVTGDAILGSDSYGDALWQRANVNQIFTGPEGGSIGSETRVTVGLGSNEWCPPCGT